jgi:NAD-dependent deacetylase
MSLQDPGPSPPLPDDARQKIELAADALRQAKRVCCLTGAGVSAESGVPTFRGPDGLWNGRRPEDVATPEAFDADPIDVWSFYLHRRRGMASVQPNPGHFALAEIQRALGDFTLVTQNIDGLHQKAGSQKTICLHGDIWINRCTRCGLECRAVPTPPANADPPIEADTKTIQADSVSIADNIPHCEACGAMTRPGVVWFGEILPPNAIQFAAQAARKCNVMLVVGTSAVVHPAASLAYWAKERGALLIEINPDETPLTDLTDIRLPLPSAVALPSIANRLKTATE